MTTNWKIQRSLVAALALGVAVGACNVLDVHNPNSLTEESIDAPAAATALVNGSVAAVYRAISNQWLGYLMASDEIVWIGSRDAWGQLDQGFVSNPANEFTDAAFPLITQGRWVADRAVTTMDEHVKNTPTAQMKTDQARAYLMAGLMYTIIGETQEDFVFGDKQEADGAVGPTKMSTIIDQAITKLDKAVAIATDVNTPASGEILTKALAIRARAKHSRAIWDKIKPTVNTASPLVSNAGASADAAAVLARVAANYRYQLTFTATTLSSLMASEINSRGESQFDTTSVVQVNKAAPKTINGVKLQDPIDKKADPRIVAFLTEWKAPQAIAAAGDVYAPLTVASAKYMNLILAEDALAKNDMATFTTRINNVRAVDGLTPYSGQIPAIDMLKYERRAALFVTGVRLMDMFRFGIKDPLWHPQSDLMLKPGTLLPITCIERNSNSKLERC